RRQQCRIHDLFQVAMGDRGETVAERNDLALLGESNPAVEAAWRLREDGPVRASAAAPDRPSTAMEQSKTDAVIPAHFRQARLRIVQRPVGGQVAAVLAAVRVAEHDLLKVAAGSYLQPVRPVC